MTTPDRHDDINAWFNLLALARPDPLASASSRLGSVAAGPTAPPPLPMPASAPPGSVISTDRPGAWWYVPAGTPPPGGWDVLVMLDGDRWFEDQPTLLDDMIGSGIIPETATLVLAHGDLSNRVAELSCNPAFVDEVISLLGQAPAPVTTDPTRTAICGQSLGGLTALYAQCLAPSRFGISICQSGSFWWPHRVGGHEAEWLTAAIDSTDHRFHAVHLEAGLAEWVLLDSTRRMRDVIEPRTERFTYDEFDGGHDPACWSAGLPAALRRHCLPRQNTPNEGEHRR